MKIEILKVENGKIVEPENDDMPACIMSGCGGGGGSCYVTCPCCSFDTQWFFCC